MIHYIIQNNLCLVKDSVKYTNHKRVGEHGILDEIKVSKAFENLDGHLNVRVGNSMCLKCRLAEKKLCYKYWLTGEAV